MLQFNGTAGDSQEGRYTRSKEQKEMPKLNEAPVEVPGTKKLTGTFTYPPPLCIGEPFVEANKRGGKDERSKGKQLIGGPMRGTIAFPGNFSTIPFLYVVC
jgi:hypothetical protein